MEYRDIITGKMTPVNPEDAKTVENLEKKIADLEAIVAKLVEEKGV